MTRPLLSPRMLLPLLLPRAARGEASKGAIR